MGVIIFTKKMDRVIKKYGVILVKSWNEQGTKIQSQSFNRKSKGLDALAAKFVWIPKDTLLLFWNLQKF